MDTIKIPCTITISDALLRGSVVAGNFEHHLTTEQLAILQPVEVVYVAMLSEGTVTRLRVVSTDWLSILLSIQKGAAAIEEEAARKIDEKAKRDREEQEKLDRLDAIVKTATLDEIVHLNGYGQYVAEWPSEAFAIGAKSRGYSEPQVETALRRTGRYEEVMSEVKRLEAVAREEKEATKAKREAKEKAKEEAAKALSLQRREWVLAHSDGLPPNIIRAAREGREISKGLADWLEEQIGAMSLVIADGCEGYLANHTYGEEIRDGVPSAKSYAVLDYVTEHLDDYRVATLGESEPGERELVRVDVEPHGAAVWRTAVKITLLSTLGFDDSHQYILTEPLNLDTDTDDE